MMKEVINEVGHENVIQIITHNVANCNGAGQIIESQFPNIVWTPCLVHILNLALRNRCAARNIDSNQYVFAKCSWISEISDSNMFIKYFIMNHSMRLAMFNEFVFENTCSSKNTIRTYHRYA